MDDVTFSRATPEDAEAVVDLLDAAYRAARGVEGWTGESHLVAGRRAVPALVRDELGDPRTTMLLARDAGGRLLGCCQVTLRPEAAAGEGTVGYIGTFAVDPEQQGAGLGGRLLAAAEDEARALGSTTAELTVISVRTELIAWYERCGYARTGAQAPYPYGDARYGDPLRDDLVMDVFRKEL